MSASRASWHGRRIRHACIWRLASASRYESNDALFKHRYGNCLFASITGILFLFLIIFTFSTNNVFETRNTYCKCGFLSSICPQNFINFSKILCLSPTLEITSIPTVDEEDSIFYMYRYNNGSATLMMEDPISLKQITLKQVEIKFGYNSVEPWIIDINSIWTLSDIDSCKFWL